MRAILAFALVSVAAGVFAVAGSILGGSLLGQTGLYIGALVVGALGVLVAGLIARKAGWVRPSALRAATIGGMVGFGAAAAFAVYGSQIFNNPIVPVFSVTLVGFGFLFGARLGEKT